MTPTRSDYGAKVPFDPTLWLARQVWGGMLWIMRRPVIRRAQRGSVNLFPERMRPWARENYLSQERWARRYGLRLITLVVRLFVLSVAATAIYMGLLELFNRGWLQDLPIAGSGATILKPVRLP